jgi:hypothetical protein
VKSLVLAVFASAILLSHSSLTLAVDPSDVRQPITLTPQEYSWLLNEMRGHLDAIGAAQQALSTGDMETARKAMLERGTARPKFFPPGRPPSFAHKTTEAWRAMASGMHQSYDAVAEGIANKESAAQIMGRTAKLMQYCAGCHVSYRLVAAP